MVSFPGSIAFDEFGKPFIILRDQEQQKRLTGNDAIKVSLTYRFGNMNHCVSMDESYKCDGYYSFFLERKKFYEMWSDSMKMTS